MNNRHKRTCSLNLTYNSSVDPGNEVKISWLPNISRLNEIIGVTSSFLAIRVGQNGTTQCELKQRDVQKWNKTNQIIHVAWALWRCRSTRRFPGPARRTSCPVPAPTGTRSPPPSPPPPGGPRKNRKTANSRCSFSRDASSRTASPASVPNAYGIHARITENALTTVTRIYDETRWRRPYRGTFNGHRASLVRPVSSKMSGWVDTTVSDSWNSRHCDNLVSYLF